MAHRYDCGQALPVGVADHRGAAPRVAMEPETRCVAGQGEGAGRTGGGEGGPELTQARSVAPPVGSGGPGPLSSRTAGDAHQRREGERDPRHTRDRKRNRPRDEQRRDGDRPGRAARTAEACPCRLRKGGTGVAVRLCLGDPDSQALLDRGAEEGIGSNLPARCRLAPTYAAPLVETFPEAVRISDATLYASILRLDDVLANVHLWGNPAAESPVLHRRRSGESGVAENVLRSFGRVSERAQPVVG